MLFLRLRVLLVLRLGVLRVLLLQRCGSSAVGGDEKRRDGSETNGASLPNLYETIVHLAAVDGHVLYDDATHLAVCRDVEWLVALHRAGRRRRLRGAAGRVALPPAERELLRELPPRRIGGGSARAAYPLSSPA